MKADNGSLWNCRPHQWQWHNIVNEVGRSTLSTTPDGLTGLTSPPVWRTRPLGLVIRVRVRFSCRLPYEISSKNSSLWATRRGKSHDPTVIGFDSKPACDARTDTLCCCHSVVMLLLHAQKWQLPNCRRETVWLWRRMSIQDYDFLLMSCSNHISILRRFRDSSTCVACVTTVERFFNSDSTVKITAQVCFPIRW